MKKYTSHIASVLLLLFGSTFMPFNFLHHHAEDEHSMAMHHHAKAEAHHCELDDHFCQPFTEDCQHEQHISKTIVKCFSCEFHFIKHFIPGNFTTDIFQSISYKEYHRHKPEQLLEALILLSNKGPPVVA